jgi:hypothetical protein
MKFRIGKVLIFLINALMALFIYHTKGRKSRINGVYWMPFDENYSLSSKPCLKILINDND